MHCRSSVVATDVFRFTYLILSLLPFLFTPLASLVRSASAQVPASGNDPHSTVTTSKQYIATLLSYRLHPEHEATIRTALALVPPTSWRFVRRSNLGTNLPTDFVVLETADEHVISTLSANPKVKRVSLQSGHLRNPNAALRLPKEREEDLFEEKGLRDRFNLHPFSAGDLWQRGYTGRGVSVAVFDTGLIADTSNFPNLASKTDWTGENTTEDHVGHGTFVAGLIAGSHLSCPGLAPDVQLHVFRVFTSAQVSYTSWFLDAFNYALHLDIDVLNLSIGGPDFADHPFTEKIDELAAHGVILVSAIGNDGPLWGSLNNPGDMMPVLGVGGAEPDTMLAAFSSRGMTTHELDHRHESYGRVKPDVISYARSLIAPSHRAVDRCRKLSGTSVASPVVAGTIALMASSIPPGRRRRVVTPASVKRALMASARRVSDTSIYEQGAGLLHLVDAVTEMAKIDEEFVDYYMRLDGQAPTLPSVLRKVHRGTNELSGTLANHSSLTYIATVRAALFPPLDDGNASSWKDHGDAHGAPTMTEAPTRRQTLSLPSVNDDLIPGPVATLFPAYYDLRLSACPHMWPHCAQPLFEGALPVHLNVTVLNLAGVEGRVTSLAWVPGRNGHLLDVFVTRPTRFWPWAAGMGVHLRAVGQPEERTSAEGVLHVRVVSVHEKSYSDVRLPIMADVVRPPPKRRRLLWDVFHSIRYPPGYVPRDNLAETKDMLDWLGDHPHTNFHRLFKEFLLAGFAVDILDQPLSCLGIEKASQYGGILLLDSEDFFSSNETDIIESLVEGYGVSLIVAAEWYNLDVMREIRFEDDNTRSWWSPVMAGANVPALNDVLGRFGIGLGEAVLRGDVKTGSTSFHFESGVPIVKFPAGGELLYTSGMQVYDVNASKKNEFSGVGIPDVPVLGLTKRSQGAVLVYGDSNCLDTAHGGSKCYAFFVEAVQHTIENCAAQARCEKLLAKSVVLTRDLWPSSTLFGRMARPLSEVILEVFRPHSKVAVQWSGGESGAAILTKMEDAASACVAGTALQTRPEVRMGDGEEIAVAQQRRAEPIGSENNYYKSLERRMLNLLVPLPWVERNTTSGARRSVVVHRPFRAISVIVVGLCLLILSASMQRAGTKTGFVRRPGRGVRSGRRCEREEPEWLQESVGRGGAAVQRGSVLRIPRGAYVGSQG